MVSGKNYKMQNPRITKLAQERFKYFRNNIDIEGHLSRNFRLIISYSQTLQKKQNYDQVLIDKISEINSIK